MRARDQCAVQQTLRFLLVGSHHSWPSLYAVQQRVSIGVQQRLYLFFTRHANELGVKIRRNLGRNAAAQHQPGSSLQPALNGLLDARQLLRCNCGTAFVQLHRQPLTIRNGEVNPDFVLDGYHLHGKTSLGDKFLEPLTIRPPRSTNCQRLAAERMDDPRRVDASASGRIAARKDICAIFEYQPVYEQIAIDGRVDGESDYQLSMVTRLT